MLGKRRSKRSVTQIINHRSMQADDASAPVCQALDETKQPAIRRVTWADAGKATARASKDPDAMGAAVAFTSEKRGPSGNDASATGCNADARPLLRSTTPANSFTRDIAEYVISHKGRPFENEAADDDAAGEFRDLCDGNVMRLSREIDRLLDTLYSSVSVQEKAMRIKCFMKKTKKSIAGLCGHAKPAEKSPSAAQPKSCGPAAHMQDEDHAATQHARRGEHGRWLFIRGRRPCGIQRLGDKLTK